MENNININDEYKKYILEHVGNVKIGYNFIKKHVPKLLEGCNLALLEENINQHDLSKYSDEEFMPYAEHFYGKTKGKKEDPEFDKAWKHHYENNPHHPQYWKGKEMPLEAIVEMICDWWSFSWKSHDLAEIFDYYEKDTKNDPDKKLNINTKKIVEDYLLILKKALSNLSLIKSNI